MNKVIWVIQTNLISDFSTQSVWYSAIDNGCKTKEAIVVPFKETFGNERQLKRMSVRNAVVIPYGSCKLTRLSKIRGWLGNCHVDETFRANVWNEKRDDMLNSDSVFMCVKDTHEYFTKRGSPDDEKWFIRPVKDLKQFNGTVAEVADIKQWMNSTKSGNFSFGDETEVMISPVKHIYSEARFFVVGGKVVDGSYYRMGGRLHSSHITQSEVYESAQELADKWLPHECCVIDIADTDEGLKVIEFNTINSSGFYDHDIPKIVKAMTEWARNLDISSKT